MKAEKFTEWLEERACCHDIYLWGAQGKAVNDLTIGKIVAMESSARNAARVLTHIAGKLKVDYNIKKMHAYDCSGLGVAFFIENGILTSDATAHGLYKMCTPIKVADAREGDMVFVASSTGHMTHVGYVVKGGYTIEAAGRDEGVVKRSIKQGAWSHAGRPGFWDTTAPLTRRLVYRDGQPLMRGDDVAAVQAALSDAGFSVSTDGVFGGKTAAAVEAFQRARQLDISNWGDVGKKTAKALGLDWQN